MGGTQLPRHTITQNKINTRDLKIQSQKITHINTIKTLPTYTHGNEDLKQTHETHIKY